MIINVDIDAFNLALSLFLLFQINQWRPIGIQSKFFLSIFSPLKITVCMQTTTMFMFVGDFNEETHCTLLGAQYHILVLPWLHLCQIIGGTIPPSQNFVRPFHYHSQVLFSIESIPTRPLIAPPRCHAHSLAHLSFQQIDCFIWSCNEFRGIWRRLWE